MSIELHISYINSFYSSLQQEESFIQLAERNRVRAEGLPENDSGQTRHLTLALEAHRLAAEQLQNAFTALGSQSSLFIAETEHQIEAQEQSDDSFPSPTLDLSLDLSSSSSTDPDDSPPVESPMETDLLIPLANPYQ